MNIREAILKAADHIQRSPADFEFMEERKPSCGSPGCALGWIGAYLNVEWGVSRYGYPNHVAIAMGIPAAERRPEGMFYERLNEFGRAWKWDATECATALRLYADKYHPAEERDEIPASVRAIFETKQSAAVC